MDWIRTLIVSLAVLALCGGADAADAKGKDKKPASPDQEAALRITASRDFVPFFSLATTVPRTGMLAGVVSVDVGLEVADPTLQAQIRKNNPRYRAALREALALYFALHHRPGRAPDLDALTRLMQASVDRVAGKSGAKLFLVSVLVQLK